MTPSTNGGRRHDIDALRAIAFGILILYHVGMYYVSWGWHIKSAHPAHWLEPLMILVNQWRMPLIFFISGLAVTFMLGQSKELRMPASRFAWLRIKRLLWPLVFGMLVVIPPQAYIEALSNNAFAGNYLDFLIAYFTFQPWPEGAFAGSDPGITWMHLWYLPYLLFYTLVYALVARLAASPLTQLRTWWNHRGSLGLLALPVLGLLPLGLFLFPVFPYISHDFATDWYAHAMYGLFFLLGALTGKSTAIWSKFAQIRKPALFSAAATYLLVLFRNAFQADDAGIVIDIASTILTYTNRWIWIVALLGWSYHLLNRPMPWLAYANKAVYPWYILHQTIIIVVAWQLAKLPLGGFLEPVALVALTIAGCAAGTWIIERSGNFIKSAFGMKTAIKTHNMPAAISNTATVK